MDDWKMFCELSIVVMAVMLVVSFTVGAASCNRSEQKDHEISPQAAAHQSLPAAQRERDGKCVK